MASQRGKEIVHEYTDRICGVKARRTGLDKLIGDDRRTGPFDVLLVWASDRIAAGSARSSRCGSGHQYNVTVPPRSDEPVNS